MSIISLMATVEIWGKEVWRHLVEIKRLAGMESYLKGTAPQWGDESRWVDLPSVQLAHDFVQHLAHLEGVQARVIPSVRDFLAARDKNATV